MVVLSNASLVVALTLVHSAFGLRALRAGRWDHVRGPERLLYGLGIAFGVTALVAFGSGAAGFLNGESLAALLALLAILAGRTGWREAVARLGELGRHGLGQEARSWLAVPVVAAVVLAGVLTAAPLTGSDAMQYHFQVIKQYVEKGRIVPVYWNVPAFYIGSGHMIMALGMALVGEPLALAMGYLGGLLTVATAWVMARRYVGARSAWLVCALLTLSPMMFWQMAVAGTPDGWTTFFTTIAVMAFLDSLRSGNLGDVALSGFFAGVAASCKYMTWAVPLVLGALLLYRSRGPVKAMAAFVISALIVGPWRHVLNWIWTGDPFFPFLPTLQFSNDFNPLTHHLQRSATGFEPSPWRIISYPVLLVLTGKQFGDGHYFGPIVLMAAPILLWARRLGLGEVLLFSCGVFALNALTTQYARYLLPIFPLMLVTSVSSLMCLRSQQQWRWTGRACFAAVTLFILFGAVSVGAYGWQFVPVAIGIESKDTFLSRMAPDYNVVRYVNKSLAGRDGTAMVFFRHTYYLTVPFVRGDPDNSWPMNPDKLQSGDALVGLLQRLGVRWVVKTGKYPAALAERFEELEARGALVPVASAEVENFAGKRIYGRRDRMSLVILEVEHPDRDRQPQGQSPLLGAHSGVREADRRAGSAQHLVQRERADRAPAGRGARLLPPHPDGHSCDGPLRAGEGWRG